MPLDAWEGVRAVISAPDCIDEPATVGSPRRAGFSFHSTPPPCRGSADAFPIRWGGPGDWSEGLDIPSRTWMARLLAAAALVAVGLMACTSPPSPSGSPEASPDGSPRPSPTPTGVGDPVPDNDDALAFSNFWPRRKDLLGQSVAVRGKVVFDLECPPPGAESDCVATGYLTTPETDVFLAHEEKQALLLHEEGSSIRCKAVTQLDLECRGWRQGERVLVRGEISRQAMRGQPPGEFVMEVMDREGL